MIKYLGVILVVIVTYTAYTDPTHFLPNAATGAQAVVAVAQTAQPLIGSAAQAMSVPRITTQKAEIWPGFTECAGLHQGARDYCAPAGTLVVAPYNGLFKTCGNYTEPMMFGDYFIFTDLQGYEHYFGHLEPGSCNPDGLKSGDHVFAGVTKIGRLANFYNPVMQQYVPHTHWQVRDPHGNLYDPKPVWDAR